MWPLTPQAYSTEDEPDIGYCQRLCRLWLKELKGLRGLMAKMTVPFLVSSWVDWGDCCSGWLEEVQSRNHVLLYAVIPWSTSVLERNGFFIFYFLRNLSSGTQSQPPGTRYSGLLKSCCTCCFPPSHSSTFHLPPLTLPPNSQTESSVKVQRFLNCCLITSSKYLPNACAYQTNYLLRKTNWHVENGC